MSAAARLFAEEIEPGMRVVGLGLVEHVWCSAETVDLMTTDQACHTFPPRARLTVSPFLGAEAYRRGHDLRGVPA